MSALCTPHSLCCYTQSTLLIWEFGSHGFEQLWMHPCASEYFQNMTGSEKFATSSQVQEVFWDLEMSVGLPAPQKATRTWSEATLTSGHIQEAFWGIGGGKGVGQGLPSAQDTSQMWLEDAGLRQKELPGCVLEVFWRDRRVEHGPGPTSRWPGAKSK